MPFLGICSNTIGSYECSCPDGMGGNGTIEEPCFERFDCDKNEVISACANLECFATCATFLNYQSDICPKNETQNCFRGCQCQEGFLRDTNGSCIAPENCNCDLGFIRIENEGCVNINECLDNTSICGQNKQCFDNEGSYDCICPESSG